MTSKALAPPRRPGASRRLAMWWGGHGLAQLVTIALVAAVLVLAGENIAETMRRIGVVPGFAFLGRSANFEIGESVIAFRGGDPYALAILAGFLNTLKVALAGCVLATVLGVVLGVAGLSGNLLLASLVRAYVEFVRNTPLLLQLFFWIALAQAFPPPRRAISAFDALLLTNRGVYVPSLTVHGFTTWTWVTLVVVLIVTVAALRLARRDGAFHLRRSMLVVVLGIAAAAAAAPTTGASLDLDLPTLAGFNIRGGHVLTPEFAALLTGLVVKFAAAIAEIVRAGIQSVDRGQREAARAMGLREMQIMRLVVLPQAMRVITPLTTSSYLDLAKDSSLAVAIGYPDLVSVLNTTANTTGQSLEALTIMIGAYLVLNLSISFAMNLYNRRVVLRGATRA
nr:ABC transporter permease subunit [Aureimonas leprariae]